MSIVVGTETKLVTSGITGREGTFHTLNNKRYGTDVVAGVTPGKGGQDVEGRRIVAEANLPNVETASTMNEAAEKVVSAAAGGAA